MDDESKKMLEQNLKEWDEQILRDSQNAEKLHKKVDKAANPKEWYEAGYDAHKRRKAFDAQLAENSRLIAEKNKTKSKQTAGEAIREEARREEARRKEKEEEEMEKRELSGMIVKGSKERIDNLIKELSNIINETEGYTDLFSEEQKTKINEKFYSYKEAKEELEQQEKKPFLFLRKRKIEEARQKLESIIKEYRSLFEEYLKEICQTKLNKINDEVSNLLKYGEIHNIQSMSDYIGEKMRPIKNLYNECCNEKKRKMNPRKQDIFEMASNYGVAGAQMILDNISGEGMRKLDTKIELLGGFKQVLESAKSKLDKRALEEQSKATKEKSGPISQQDIEQATSRVRISEINSNIDTIREVNSQEKGNKEEDKQMRG